MKRRGVALLGLGMIVAGLVWAAVAMAGTTVNIFGPKGNQTVDVADIPNNVKDTYNVDGRPQEIEGDSLQHVLNKLGIESDEWTQILFDGGDVGNGEKFVDDLSPVFYVNNAGDVVFLVPKKEGAEAQKYGDPNLRFTLRGRIDIDPDELDVEQGDTETFNATLVDGGPQNDYSFSWSASTGETGSGRTFDYTFDTAGRVEIKAFAERQGNVVAQGAIATPVKEPPPENNGTGGTGGTGGIGTGGTGYDSGYNYDSGYTPPSDFGGDYDSETPNPEENFPDPPKETPEDTTLPEATSGTSVSGELLAAEAPLEPESGGDASAGGEEASEAPEDEVVFEENEEVTAPGALIAAGVVVGIIGLGAGRELEDVRPRRFFRRPNFSGLRRLLPPWK